jgi:hypothetical protein
MDRPRIGSQHQPFPLTRPAVSVVLSTAAAFELELSVLPGWGVRMQPGASAWMAWYDPPDWSLTSVTYQWIARPAVVHEVECLEADSLEWEAAAPQWREGMTQFARLTATDVEWLAISRLRGEQRVLSTFLDEEFDRDFSRHPRHFADRGRLRPAGEGFELDLRGEAGRNLCFAAGMFDVTVGQRPAQCLRVIDLELRGGAEHTADAIEKSLLAESYHTVDGRLFLFRRFNGRQWALRPGSPYAGDPRAWDERLAGNQRLVINGATFVHWYDCLSDASVELA